MPWGDRTGPRGQGPRTGRGLGDCEPLTPERIKEIRAKGGVFGPPGLGLGGGGRGRFGLGRGFGNRRWF